MPAFHAASGKRLRMATVTAVTTGIAAQPKRAADNSKVGNPFDNTGKSAATQMPSSISAIAAPERHAAKGRRHNKPETAITAPSVVHTIATVRASAPSPRTYATKNVIYAM